MCRKFSALFISALFCGASFTPALADNGGGWSNDRFQVRIRAIDVVPDESSSVNIGGHVNVTNKVTPEFDISYFFTDNISAELIVATSKHHLTYSGGADLGSVWVLPPTVTLQYHFTPDRVFSPYLGAGLNYSVFYNEAHGPAFNDLKVGNGVGYALQAGADYWLDKNWGLNIDVKRIFLNVDATLNNGAVRAHVDLDPWVMGTGISYRF